MEKQMEPFRMNQDVVVKNGRLKGRIIGIWYSAFGEPQYNVRYFDSTGRPGDFWFVADELGDPSDNE